MKRAMVGLIAAAAGACSASDNGEVQSESYPTCERIESPPGELARKAAQFDEIAQSLHVPPGQDLIHTAFLTPDLESVVRYKVADNAGLWTSLYAASQAYRYATTGSQQALNNVRRAVRGELDLMRITGVAGLFARAYVDPTLPGFPTEQELYDQYPDCDLAVEHCKRWTLVTEAPYAGRLFKNDVSKDEYAGHMYAMGVVAELVDDAEIQTMATEIVTEVADHLMASSLELRDIDGEVTQHGLMSALGGDDFPGFNAALTLSWFRVAATVTGEGRFLDFYRNCLLHEDLAACSDQVAATYQPYPDYLPAVGLSVGCNANFNNHNMVQLSLFNLLRFEDVETTREQLQALYAEHIWDPVDRIPMRTQQNPLFTFFWEINRHPDTSFPAAELDDAVCVLKQYPDEKYRRAVDTSGYPEACTDRFGEPMTDQVIPVHEREADNFQWTKNPYKIEVIPEDRTRIESPEDYLLAYWMGRYYGILPAEL